MRLIRGPYNIPVSPILYAALWLLFAFLCGSIPFGAIVTRLKGIDIRTVGSGNTGATNVWRALGWKYGISVLLLDALKGFLPVFGYQQHWFAGYFQSIMDPDPPRQAMLLFIGFSAFAPFLIGLMAILGHTFSPWLGFKGGKGVAIGLGVILAIYQGWVLIPLLVFGLTLLRTRMVSLSSMLAALSLPLLGLIAHNAQPFSDHAAGLARYWPFGALVALLVIWTHRSNINRILDGSENRVGRKKEDAPG